LAGAEKGFAGARIAIRHGRFHQGEDVTSDENGRFRAHVLAGQVYQQVIVMPPGVDAMRPLRSRVEVPADVQEFRLPPLELLQVDHLTGILVNSGGQPIADARVYGIKSNQLFGNGQTDDKGQFKLRVPRGFKFNSYRVVKGDVQTEPTVLENDPLRLQTSDIP